jgi:hypothetical protein
MYGFLWHWYPPIVSSYRGTAAPHVGTPILLDMGYKAIDLTSNYVCCRFM